MKSLAPQVSMSIPIEINLNGSSKTPLEDIQDRTRLEGRIKGAVQRELLHFFEGN